MCPGDKLVTIRHYDNFAEAQMARSYLESQGILAFVQDEFSHFHGAQRLRLCIPANEQQRALELLESAASQHSQIEENELHGPECPRCGSTRTELVYAKNRWLSLVLGLTAFFKRQDHWRCLDCRYKWDG